LAVHCLGFDSGRTQYLIDHPGTVTLAVEASGAPGSGLKASETAAFIANLRYFRDLLIAQPVFHPILGVEAKGSPMPSSGGQINKTEPIRGGGYVIYLPYFLAPKTQKPGLPDTSPWEVDIYFNNPLGGLRMNGGFYYELRLAGRLHGFPVYRNNINTCEYIVLSSTGKSLWIPLTREEYMKHCIAEIEKIVAEETKNGPQIDKSALALLSPEDRATLEKLAADNVALKLAKQRLKRHQEVLAQMSSQERAAQARYGHLGDEDLFGTELAPVGQEGDGYVKANPEWFDPSCPRSDLQLIIVKFDYASMNPDHPAINARTDDACDLRLWETLHKLDWKAISKSLAR
jgi:hypothetical protein